MDQLATAEHPARTDPDHRARLLSGLASAVDQKGYHATTIADIARAAKVSKRTFYEYFSGKPECFLAWYAQATEQALSLVTAAADPGKPAEQQVRAAVQAYLSVLAAQPGLTRTLLLEVHAVGEQAVALRREGISRFAGLLCELVRRARTASPQLRELTPAMSTALIGAVNELVLMAVEQDGAAHVTDLVDTLADLVWSALRTPHV